MQKNRLEAFSDGVIAIIITIMVLEIKVPHDTSVEALLNLAPVFFSYVLSFVYVAIYWNNHHHLFHSVQKVNGNVLWANMHLLFWLSLIPFASGWMGENHFVSPTVTLYGFILLMAAVAYYFLTVSLIKNHGHKSDIARAVGNKTKENISLALYLLALPLSYWFPVISFVFYVIVAFIWLLPDRRIERVLSNREH